MYVENKYNYVYNNIINLEITKIAHEQSYLINKSDFFRYSCSYIRGFEKACRNAHANKISSSRAYARASCTQKRNGSFGVVNAPRSGKNPGLVYRGRQRRDSCVAAGSACHEPMGSPSNADDADGR